MPRILVGRGLRSTADLAEHFQDLGRSRRDRPEIYVWEENITVKQHTVFATISVHMESITIPETVDCIRAALGLERDNWVSVGKTDRTGNREGSRLLPEVISMNVAVLCPLWPDALRQLQSRHDCVASVQPDEAAKFRLVADAEVVVLRSPIVLDRAAIERAQRLRLVVRAGVGWDNVDQLAARERGIQTVCVPVSAQSVAEHVFGLTLALCRNICRLHRSLQEGRWEKHLGFGRACQAEPWDSSVSAGSASARRRSPRASG